MLVVPICVEVYGGLEFQNDVEKKSLNIESLQMIAVILRKKLLDKWRRLV